MSQDTGQRGSKYIGTCRKLAFKSKQTQGLRYPAWSQSQQPATYWLFLWMTGKENSFLPQQPFSTSLAQSTELSTTLKSDPIHIEETILEASVTAQLAQLSPYTCKELVPSTKNKHKNSFYKRKWHCIYEQWDTFNCFKLRCTDPLTYTRYPSTH